MKLCARAGRIDRVERLLKWMDERQVAPNIITITTMVQAYGHAQNLPKAFEVFEDLEKRGIPADNRLYNSLLNACVLTSDVDKASSVLEKVREAGLPPDIVMYSTLLKLCQSQSDSDKAWEIFQMMHSHGRLLKPNIITYNTIITTLINAKRPEELKQVLEWLQKDNIEPNEKLYTTLLRSCQIVGGIRRGVNLYKEMEEKNLVDCWGFNMLLLLLRNKKASIQIVKDMYFSTSQKCKDWTSLRLFTDILINTQSFDLMQPAIEEFLQEGLLNWSQTSRHWIMDFKKWDLGAAFFVFNEMLQSQVRIFSSRDDFETKKLLIFNEDDSFRSFMKERLLQLQPPLTCVDNSKDRLEISASTLKSWMDTKKVSFDL